MADEKETAVVETTQQDELKSIQAEFDSKMNEPETQYAEEPVAKKVDGYEIENDDDDEEPAVENIEADDEEPVGKTDDDEKPVVDDALLARAIKAGFDPEEAMAFKTPESLQRVLDAMEPKQGAEKPAEAPEQPENPFEYKLSLDPEEYDLEQGIGAEMVKMNKHYATLVNSLIGRLGSMAGDQYTERFDSAIGGLGEDWKGVFGDGGLSDIDPQGAEFKARQRLDREVSVIQKGRAALGRPPLPLKEAMQRALRSEFTKEQQSFEDSQRKNQLKHRNRQKLIRPASQVGARGTSRSSEVLQLQRDFDRQLQEERG